MAQNNGEQDIAQQRFAQLENAGLARIENVTVDNNEKTTLILRLDYNGIVASKPILTTSGINALNYVLDNNTYDLIMQYAAQNHVTSIEFVLLTHPTAASLDVGTKLIILPLTERLSTPLGENIDTYRITLSAERGPLQKVDFRSNFATQVANTLCTHGVHLTEISVHTNSRGAEAFLATCTELSEKHALVKFDIAPIIAPWRPALEARRNDFSQDLGFNSGFLLK